MQNDPNHIPYKSSPLKQIEFEGKTISIFTSDDKNVDNSTISSFADEWTKFDSFSSSEINEIGNEYFDIVAPELLNKNETIVLDLGCGTGRWSVYLADKVKSIDAIDPSDAVFSAAKLTKNYPNIRISKASAGSIPFDDDSFDLVISMGVLHHIPDTQMALANLVNKLKLNGHCLIYLYYALDNRSFLFKLLFHFSNLLRRVISTFPKTLKKISCDLLALTIYLPFIGIAYLVKFLAGKLYLKLPLSYYVYKSWNVIRNDALDRFGTPLEKRFTKTQITRMMHEAGLSNIVFSPNMPYWHAIGQKI